MQMKAVIFDFDGVITETMSLHLQAWQESYLQLFDKKLIFPQKLIGMATQDIAILLCESRKDLVEKLISDKRIRVSELAAKPISLLEGAEEYIKYLQYKKIPFAICSNAPKNFILDILSQHQLNGFIVNGIEDAPKAKPAPDSYIKTANQLGFVQEDFKDIIVYEDSFHGLKAAVRAGMHAVGIATYHTHEELLLNGAKEVFSDLKNALEFVTAKIDLHHHN